MILDVVSLAKLFLAWVGPSYFVLRYAQSKICRVAFDISAFEWNSSLGQSGPISGCASNLSDSNLQWDTVLGSDKHRSMAAT